MEYDVLIRSGGPGAGGRTGERLTALRDAVTAGELDDGAVLHPYGLRDLAGFH